MNTEKNQKFTVDLLKVLKVIEQNESRTDCKDVPSILGVSKTFEIPTRKIHAVCVEYESKTDVLREIIKLAISQCTTDEETFYFIYAAIMVLALGQQESADPMQALIRMMRGE